MKRLVKVMATGTLIVTLGGSGRPLVGQTVDSILPASVELARFRATVKGRPPKALSGQASIEKLVEKFVRAVESRDSAAIRGLLINRSEFAYLYFPSSEFAARPYRQNPALVWFRLRAVSEKGIGRVLSRDGGRSLGYRGFRCSPKPKVQGNNRIWSGCVLRIERNGQLRSRKLFGSIIERDGHFKFLSYASDY